MIIDSCWNTWILLGILIILIIFLVMLISAFSFMNNKINQAAKISRDLGEKLNNGVDTIVNKLFPGQNIDQVVENVGDRIRSVILDDNVILNRRKNNTSSEVVDSLREMRKNKHSTLSSYETSDFDSRKHSCSENLYSSDSHQKYIPSHKSYDNTRYHKSYNPCNKSCDLTQTYHDIHVKTDTDSEIKYDKVSDCTSKSNTDSDSHKK